MKDYQKARIKAEAIAEICEYIDTLAQSAADSIPEFEECLRRAKENDDRWSVESYTKTLEELSERQKTYADAIKSLLK